MWRNDIAVCAQRHSTITDDNEEERKQKEFKGLLNKITPEKYQTICAKMLNIDVNHPSTLHSLIMQARSLACLVHCNLKCLCKVLC